MLLIKDGIIYNMYNGLPGMTADTGSPATTDILIKDNIIIDISKNIPEADDMTVINATGLIIAPGLIDMHVHFREPGFEYKEDMQSGAAAAAAGGFTTVCCMPNTSPVADCKDVIDSINKKTKHGDRYSASSVPITVMPVGAVTLGQKGEKLTNFTELKKAGVIALSDDGMPIVNPDVMRKALIAAEKENMLIISHCEEEETMAERDVRLAEETGTRVHIAHVSTAKAVESIRKAKSAGVKVTAETCPHYFSLTRDTIKEKGTNAKMNPPLRSKKDVEAIIEGLSDGTIDAIATDHAPHSADEKALPFDDAPNGIIGLETSLAVSLTFLYHTGLFTIEEVINLMSKNPAKILNLNAGVLEKGATADIVIFDPDEEWMVDSGKFKSKSRNTPYDGMKLKGNVKHTISRVSYGLRSRTMGTGSLDSK